MPGFFLSFLCDSASLREITFFNHIGLLIFHAETLRRWEIFSFFPLRLREVIFPNHSGLIIFSTGESC